MYLNIFLYQKKSIKKKFKKINIFDHENKNNPFYIKNQISKISIFDENNLLMKDICDFLIYCDLAQNTRNFHKEYRLCKNMMNDFNAFVLSSGINIKLKYQTVIDDFDPNAQSNTIYPLYAKIGVFTKNQIATLFFELIGKFNNAKLVEIFSFMFMGSHKHILDEFVAV